MVVDILDPHDPGREDWLPKVRGLAEYADKHWKSFGRIEASIVVKSVVHRLDRRGALSASVATFDAGHASRTASARGPKLVPP